LLAQQRVQLDALAALLLQKEVVFKEDLDAILGPREVAAAIPLSARKEGLQSTTSSILS